jgi:tRNA(Ile)-lysidine synthase
VRTKRIALGHIDAVLDARLLTGDPSPVAIAFSGGGDSLALLLAANAWARSHGRPLVALTVDHGLRPESAAWTAFCRTRATALGIEHRILAWEGRKPTAGVPAAARAARHRLLADAARAAGARVILMGHTADDCAEAALMRQSGSTTSSPELWAPSPVWPEGRGVFLLRPLLGLRRATLRDLLSALGETWIDDPGNADPRSPRARARMVVAGAPLVDEPAVASLARANPIADITWGSAGDLLAPVDALIDSADGLRRLGAALLCAAGGQRPPRREPLARLMARLAAREAFAATLAGCRVECDGRRFHLIRDAGDTRSRALIDIPLPAEGTVVWDGRFEVRAQAPGATVGPLAGRAARLAPGLRRALANLAPAARRVLPRVAFADGREALPTVRPDPAVNICPLAPARYAAALGAFIDEDALRRIAKPALPY